MHPDVSPYRAEVRRYLDTPDQYQAALKQKLPQHDIQVRDGQVVIRRPDEKDYKVVDPSFLSGGLREVGRDISDLAYEIPSMALAGVGGIAGAAAGALAGPVGAVAGGVAGVGAGEAAAEGLKQTIAKKKKETEGARTNSVRCWNTAGECSCSPTYATTAYATTSSSTTESL